MFKQNLRYLLNNNVIISPDTIRRLDAMNFGPLPSHYCLSMEERSVFIIKFDPFITRLLEPMYFLIKEDVVVISLKLFLGMDMVKRINSF